MRIERLIAAATLLLGCNQASFNGSNAPASPKPAVAAEVTPMMTPAPTTIAAPGPGGLPSCVNRFLNGFYDPVSHHNYKVLTVPMNLCETEAACEKAGPGGQLTWPGLVMPDDVTSCGTQLNGWIQRFSGDAHTVCSSGLGLYTQPGGIQTDPSQRFPGSICIY